MNRQNLIKILLLLVPIMTLPGLYAKDLVRIEIERGTGNEIYLLEKVEGYYQVSHVDYLGHKRVNWLRYKQYKTLLKNAQSLAQDLEFNKRHEYEDTLHCGLSGELRVYDYTDGDQENICLKTKLGKDLKNLADGIHYWIYQERQIFRTKAKTYSTELFITN